MATYKTFGALASSMNKKIDIAVQNSCNRLLGALQQLIDSEFYEVYDPERYDRTHQFWESATTKMLKQNCGQIFMDKTKMNYNGFWTGEKQLFEANLGSHGGWVTDESKEHRFWDAFIEYCQDNAFNILVEELKKQGLNIK